MLGRAGSWVGNTVGGLSLGRFWLYQDFAAGSGPNLTISANGNGSGGAFVFNAVNVVDNSAVATKTNGNPTYTNTAELSAQLVTTSNTGAAVTLSGTPAVGEGTVRVWYLYTMSTAQAPSNMQVASEFVVNARAQYLDARYLEIANNLSDIANAATARTNLGLGTVATKAQTVGTSILKGDNAGGFANAVAGTDYQAPVTIGALDAQAANANGLAFVSNVLSAQSADATHPGMVNNVAQTFSGVKTFSSAPNLSSLSASLPLQLDGSKNIISSAIDLSGSQATGTLAAARFPALTGDTTTTAGSLVTTTAKVNGVSYPSSPGTNTVPVVTSANTITYETCPVNAGGTGQTSYTDGQLLIGNTGGGNTLTKATLTAGTGVQITNAGGSITVAAQGGNGKSGSVALSQGVTSKAITFNTSFGSTSYCPEATLRNTTDASPIHVPMTIIAKTATGFTVEWLDPIPTGSYSLEWSIVGYYDP